MIEWFKIQQYEKHDFCGSKKGNFTFLQGRNRSVCEDQYTSQKYVGSKEILIMSSKKQRGGNQSGQDLP